MNAARGLVGVLFAMTFVGHFHSTRAANGPADSKIDATTEALAPIVDLRPSFEKWGLSPRRQGKRGTCSVFTVTGSLEFAAARQLQRGQRFSVEFLNWA